MTAPCNAPSTKFAMKADRKDARLDGYTCHALPIFRQLSEIMPNHFLIVYVVVMSERGRGRGAGRRSDGRRDGSWTWGLVSKTVATGPGETWVDLESNFNGQMICETSGDACM